MHPQWDATHNRFESGSENTKSCSRSGTYTTDMDLLQNKVGRGVRQFNANTQGCTRTPKTSLEAYRSTCKARGKTSPCQDNCA